MESTRFSQLIREARVTYLKRHFPNNPYITYQEINESSSDLFAAYITMRLAKFKAVPVGFVRTYNTSMICNENMYIRTDSDIIEEFNKSNRKDINRNELGNIALPVYSFIYNEGKYYDIETPEGVYSIFDLPLIVRHIKQYKMLIPTYVYEQPELLPLENRIPFRIVKKKG